MDTEIQFCVIFTSQYFPFNTVFSFNVKIILSPEAIQNEKWTRFSQWVIVCQSLSYSSNILFIWVFFDLIDFKQYIIISCQKYQFSSVVFDPLQPHGLQHARFPVHHQLQGLPYSSDGKESASCAGDLGSNPGSGRSPGEGNGNPLQYSCLENPMDKGVCRATVHRFTKSWTHLSD